MSPGVWKSLVSENEVGRVALAFEDAIAASFAFDQMQSVISIHRITQAEVKRRFEICAKIFEWCRGDLKWSVPRTLDHLPVYLRNELDGVQWQPSTRETWAGQQEIKT